MVEYMWSLVFQSEDGYTEVYVSEDEATIRERAGRVYAANQTAETDTIKVVRAPVLEKREDPEPCVEEVYIPTDHDLSYYLKGGPLNG